MHYTPWTVSMVTELTAQQPVGMETSNDVIKAHITAAQYPVQAGIFGRTFRTPPVCRVQRITLLILFDRLAENFHPFSYRRCELNRRQSATGSVNSIPDYLMHRISKLLWVGLPRAFHWPLIKCHQHMFKQRFKNVAMLFSDSLVKLLLQS